jgi:site-specific DNA-methyltransferase (adenine-specific)
MYIQGDIHDVIKTLETNTIDLIYTNPPFGITQKDWDTPLDWDNLWKDIWRVVKPRGIVALHASMPFSYTLIKSQTPKYHYHIKKSNSTGFLSSKYQPLRNTEELYIFYKKSGTYNPQMTGNEIRTATVATNWNGYYGDYPQKKSRITKKYVGKFPTTSLDMITTVRGGKTVDDNLVKYVLKTYSNEGDTVLDMTCHNKVVGNICEELNRKYIGVDKIEISIYSDC